MSNRRPARRTKVFAAGLGLVVTAALSACGSSGGGSSQPANTSPGSTAPSTTVAPTSGGSSY